MPLLCEAFLWMVFFLQVSDLIIAIVALITFIHLVILRGDASDTFIEAISLASVIAVTAADFESAFLQTTLYWPLFVLVVDSLLVCEAPGRMSIVVVCWCCVYMLIIASESTFRYGLFDIEWKHYAQSYRREQFDCEKLPCAKEFWPTVMDFVSRSFVFLLEFIWTRGFAAALLEEKNNILASIDTANAIATSLSRFDLEQATSLLEDADIPEGLRDALKQILCNLRSYRPYLPQSCIPALYSSGSAEESVRSRTYEEESSHSSTHANNKSGLPNNVRKKFECVSASLLVANIRNSFAVLQHSQDSFNGLISDMISATSDVIVKHRGTLDLFLGGSCLCELWCYEESCESSYFVYGYCDCDHITRESDVGSLPRVGERKPLVEHRDGFRKACAWRSR